MLTTPHIELRISGETIPLTCEHALRFVERPGHDPEPVLYKRGHRVAQAWSLHLEIDSPADQHPNANTT